MTDIADALAVYATYMENIAPDNVSELRTLGTPDMRFLDPFNDVSGIDRVVACFDDIWENAKAVKITVHDRAVSGRTGYLRWTFAMTPRRGGSDWSFEGMSEIRFDADGKVTAHIDHWDSGRQFYAKLPLIGLAVRGIMRKLSVKR